MKKQLFTNHRPLFFVALCLTFFFWMFFILQGIATHVTPSKQAIPAFLNTCSNPSPDFTSAYSSDCNHSEAALLNETTLCLPTSYFYPQNTDRASAKQLIIQFLKKQDSQIQLISCHKEKNYTDLYFFSPEISQRSSSDFTETFNLQVAVTEKYVYFGTPLIQYDF